MNGANPGVHAQGEVVTNPAAPADGSTTIRTANVQKYAVGQYVRNLGVQRVSGRVVSAVADAGATGPGTLTIEGSLASLMSGDADPVSDWPDMLKVLQKEGSGAALEL